MPKGMLPLLSAIAVFVAIVVSVLAWAFLSGEAGERRGLVITSELREPVTIEFEDGREAAIEAFGRQTTFVLRRDEFPQTISAVGEAGDVIVSQEMTYDEIADAEFRISVDRNGFYPTDTIRTPAP